MLLLDIFLWFGSLFAPILGWFLIGFLVCYLGETDDLSQILTSIGSHAVLHFLPEQNLKQKYQANWAFISGGSTGLGYAIAEKLAAQGLNLAIAALPDKFFAEAVENLKKKYPNIEIRKIDVDLGDTKCSYMEKIEEATRDISIQVVFSNAGAIIISLFPKTKRERIALNWSLNITSHINITHHFFERMVNEKKKGCIVYTSSNAGFWPSPTSTLYGAAKAAMLQMASSLAIEGREYGIDVTALCSGPMATRFVDNVEGAKLDALASFMKVASTPDQVASRMLASVGRVSNYDHSLMTVGLRVVFRFVDTNFFAKIIAIAQPYTSDWAKIEH